MKKVFRSSLKTVLIVPAAVFLTLAVSGCQNASDKNSAQNNEMNYRSLDRRIGTIQSLGGYATTNQGTHLLKLDDGSTILLRTASLNLDDAKYKDNKVEIAGQITYTNDNKQIMDVRNIDILDSAITEPTAVVSWKDYSSEKLSLSLRYRDDFKVDDTDQFSVKFFRPLSEQAMTTRSQDGNPTATKIPVNTSSASAEGHSIIFSQIPALNTHEDFMKYMKDQGVQSDSATDLLTAGFTKSKIGIDGFTAFKKTTNNGQTIEFYMDAGNKFYHINYVGGTDSQSLEDQNTFYQILTSLKVSGSTVVGTDTPLVKSVPATVPTPTPIAAATTPSNPAFVPPAPVVSKPPEVLPPSKDVIVPPNPATSAATPDSSTTTSEPLAGFKLFESATSKFSLQYPKGWYYSIGKSSDTNVIRHYNFDNKPVDDQGGTVGVDILSGSLPAGSSVSTGTKTAVKVVSGSSVEIYVKGSGSRVYRLSGPSSNEATLLIMADTLKD